MRKPNKNNEVEKGIPLTPLGAGATIRPPAAAPSKKSSTGIIDRILLRLKNNKKSPSPGTPSSGADEDLLTPDDRLDEKKRAQEARKAINQAENAKLCLFLNTLCETETKKAKEAEKPSDTLSQASISPQ